MADISLLPYLSGSGAPFSLEFSAHGEENAAGGVPRFPFAIISDAGSLTRIISAAVISDAGSPIRQVFLMISRDDYARLESASNPLTNSDIDLIWKRAFQDYNKKGSLIALSPQSCDGAEAIPFRPLFFCTKTRVFFHPPCPKCGQPLELCRDDAVLSASGLKAYSSSLKRYLVCPTCLDSGKGGEFYAKEPDDSDPVQVKGPHDLIQAFKGLEQGGIPCARCPEHNSCFTDGKASSFIVPICFYPFNLIMFEAASLNASDFLSLISGAACPELEKGLNDQRQFVRSRCVGRFSDKSETLTLFPGDERQFLEILYLKIAFLGEVARHILPGEETFSPLEIRLSLQDLWLRIPEQSSLLPAFWNFKLAAVDIDRQVPGMLALQGPGYAHRVLGMLWFHALLKNRLQDIKAVNEVLSRVLKEKQLDSDEDIFRPKNNFWEPRPVPEKYEAVWNKTLDMATALFLEEGTSGFSVEGFQNAYNTLKDEIKAELFSGIQPADPVLPAAGKDGTKSDEEIGLILDRIKSKWKQGAPAPKEIKPAKPATLQQPSAGNVPSEAEATVVLTLPDAPHELKETHAGTISSATTSPPKVKPDPEEDDFRNETVILQSIPDITSAATPPQGNGSAKNLGSYGDTAKGRTQEPKDHNAEATVILEPAAQNIHVQQRPEQVRHDDPEATLILEAGGQSTPVKQQAEPPRYDDPEATMIMGASAKSTPPVRQEAGPEKQADPEATVMMGAGGQSTPVKQQAEPPRYDDPEATMMMGAAGQSAPVKQQAETPKYDDPEATMIMGASGKSIPVQKQAEPAGYDDPEATLIMGSTIRNAAPAQPKPSREGNDEMAETIIMPPSKKK